MELKQELISLNGTAGVAADELISRAIEYASGPVSLACSFSREDVVLIDIIHQSGLDAGVFAIDTGRLNEETFEVAEEVFRRYGGIVKWYFPKRDIVEELERRKGLYSFRSSLENRHECCYVRKVEPLQRALEGLGGWITGLRREQSITRDGLAAVETDALNGDIIKINPMADWTEDQVKEYVLDNDLPVNRLFGQGYLSVGCAPCTRPVRPGEHPRAGRWWWEAAKDKECGLHVR